MNIGIDSQVQLWILQSLLCGSVFLTLWISIWISMISRVQDSYGYEAMDMDIHMDIHSDFSRKSLTFWISWISTGISTGISTLISGYPFIYPILILDFQFELWISKPISISNLWISTLDIQCYPH